MSGSYVHMLKIGFYVTSDNMTRCLLIVRIICLNVNNDEAVWETRAPNIDECKSDIKVVFS